MVVDAWCMWCAGGLVEGWWRVWGLRLGVGCLFEYLTSFKALSMKALGYFFISRCFRKSWIVFQNFSSFKFDLKTQMALPLMMPVSVCFGWLVVKCKYWKVFVHLKCVHTYV